MQKDLLSTKEHTKEGREEHKRKRQRKQDSDMASKIQP